MCRLELESHLKRNRKKKRSAQNNEEIQIKTAKIYFHLSDWQNTFKEG